MCHRRVAPSTFYQNVVEDPGRKTGGENVPGRRPAAFRALFLFLSSKCHGREPVGFYERFDKPALVALINDLYVNQWSAFTNFFCPTLKLKAKTRINSKLRRQYHTPQTPYERLCASEHIPDDAKQRLTNLFRSLNPFALQRAIQGKLRLVFDTLRAPAPEAPAPPP